MMLIVAKGIEYYARRLDDSGGKLPEDSTDSFFRQEFAILMIGETATGER
jgi:hypothetical protein